MSLNGLFEPAVKALNECLRVSKDDSALLIFDHTTEDIAEAFIRAASESGLSLDPIRIDPTSGDGADPDPECSEKMLSYNVIIAPTRFSLTHCPATQKARKSGARVATLPGITSAIFARGLMIDHLALSGSGKKWIERLVGSQTLRLTSKAGTDLSFSTGSVKFRNDDGLIHSAGQAGNLPAGEIFTCPDKASANGVLVIDGSIGSLPWNPSEEPARIVIKDGMATDFQGKRALKLKSILTSAGGDEALELAEFGIGTNPSLKLSGNLLEDEKVKGTVHLAFGNSKGFGGWNTVPVHIDGLVLSPTLRSASSTLIESGDWQIQ